MKQTDHEKRPAPGQIVHVVIDRPMNTYLTIRSTRIFSIR